MRRARSTRLAYFPARLASLAEIVDFVTNAARAAGLDDAGVYSIQIAVDEACTNIIQYGYKGRPDGQIECQCDLNADGLTVTLCDQGVCFDPTLVPPPDTTSKLEERQVGGLGIYFIRQMMDELQFQHIPGDAQTPGVNVLKLVKRKETQ